MAAMAGWQGAQEEAKQSPSVGPSLGGGAVAAEVVRCGGGGVRDVRVRHEERDNSESLSGCANRHGSRGRGGDGLRGSSSPAWHVPPHAPPPDTLSTNAVHTEQRQKWANNMNNLVCFSPEQTKAKEN